MRVRQILLFLCLVSLLGMASAASAAVVANGEIAAGEGGTFAVPASLINGAPAFTGGAAPLYGSPWAMWPQMADAYIGAASEQNCMLLDNITDSPWAVWILDTTAKPSGYNVDSIQSFAGFNQNRPWQGVEVKYALVGDAVTQGSELGRTLGSFYYQPADLGMGYNATKMTIADDVATTMLTGVSAIQIKFIDNGFTQGESTNLTSYREVAVYGPDAVPVLQGVHVTGTTHSTDVIAPQLPANNLILQGSSTLSNSYAGGASPASWGSQLPGGMNDGVMTDANVLPILAWDGVTEDFGWAVYQLDTTTNTLGYDISNILSYASWTGARVNQAVEIKYAVVGDTVTEGSELGRTLGTFTYAPSDNSDTVNFVYTTMSITNDPGLPVITGVTAIEVKYVDNMFDGTTGNPNAPGNYTAYKQFAVIGTVSTTGPVLDIPGDANRDNVVDAEDAAFLAANWLKSTGATWGMGDFNGDGAVNDIDATMMAANWGYGVANASVPEPSTLAGLLALCLAGLLVRARRKQQ